MSDANGWENYSKLVLQQLETLKKQQRDIVKKMYALEQESKLIGV